ncbi:Ergothioneine biosynthesis protein 1 [Paramyrothecium foliicola]|nr:Ergothioneine biosynthesis protein 1 [Paramyrothecium foliicola]
MPAVRESPHGLLARRRTNADIIDIRGPQVEYNLKDDIVALFNPAKGPRKLPTLLLYDEKGLQLFEDITHLEEYYLTNYEIDVLKKSAADMASSIPAHSMVIELGSGNLRKVCLLLQALEDQGKQVDYYALDLSREELERTLAQVPHFKHVSCHGLLGTYDDGREWLKQPTLAARPKTVMHLGSSIGNFSRDEAADFLAGFADILQPTDSIMMGIDSCNDPEKIFHAYNDKEGLTHRFTLNGLKHANEVLGQDVFNLDDWEAIGEYVFDDEGGRHQAFVSPTREVEVLGSVVQPHERIQIEQSFKYSKSGYTKLFAASGLNQVKHWSRGDEYGIHMLQKTDMSFSPIPAIYASGPLPTLHDWEGLWQTWDTISQQMLPNEELTGKPIKLRNACIFYLGHIPGFLDIQLCKGTKLPPSEPAYYHAIFERGIDPDVDNPEKCHDHSEIPDEWPPVEDILAYQERVRSRLRGLYEKGADAIPREVGEVIWLGFEHEVMHIETFLYMLLQSDKTLPPPHVPRPDFEKLARKAREARVPNQWFDIPAQTVTIGLQEPEDGSGAPHHFGWDNEKPARQEEVHAFQAQGRAITNEDYANYLYNKKIDNIPASWSKQEPTTNGVTNGHTNGHTNGASNGANVAPESFLADKSVRTVYGLVPLKYALDWPVFASYDELAGCAAWMGGRIPTFEETKSIYQYAHNQKKLVTLSRLTKKVPAVNGHLVNDGVEETPPELVPATSVDDGSDELFIDLAGANVGFRHWHPVPVTSRGGSLAGQSEMGGVWEWTSSPLRRHEGFEPMPLYPAYTADFFDDKHNVVLGGSWATHPRIAGRRSFVNWYQRNYPYAWAGARLVRDV